MTESMTDQVLGLAKLVGISISDENLPEVANRFSSLMAELNSLTEMDLADIQPVSVFPDEDQPLWAFTLGSTVVAPGDGVIERVGGRLTSLECGIIVYGVPEGTMCRKAGLIWGIPGKDVNVSSECPLGFTRIHIALPGVKCTS